MFMVKYLLPSVCVCVCLYIKCFLFLDLDECKEYAGKACEDGYDCVNTKDGQGYCCIPKPHYYSTYSGDDDDGSDDDDDDH